MAILGFGMNPPRLNLELAKAAVSKLAAHEYGIAVGNLVGTFAIAIETADQLSIETVAVVDETMQRLARPDSTNVIVVAANEKHATIAQLASGGIILGGGNGTRKLVDQLILANKPLVGILGTGGAADDGTLPESIPFFTSLDEAIPQLLEQMKLSAD